jgi:VPDSG-CTERM motif
MKTGVSGMKTGVSGMKTRLTLPRKVALLGVICAVTLVSVNNAKALPLPLIDLALGDQRELGQVHPALSQGDAAITQYVNFMIGLSFGGSGHVIIGPHDNLVTRSMNDFDALPSAAALALRGKGATIDLGTQGTYDYLFAHYGGPRGGFAEVWYVGNLSGMITIPGNAFRHGLSGWALFTGRNAGVPDGGSTAMLLGAALGAFAVLRRYIL